MTGRRPTLWTLRSPLIFYTGITQRDYNLSVFISWKYYNLFITASLSNFGKISRLEGCGRSVEKHRCMWRSLELRFHLAEQSNGRDECVGSGLVLVVVVVGESGREICTVGR
jgi:hypothetical protein